MSKLIKSLISFLSIFLISYTGHCQQKDNETKNLESYIVNLDKAGWEAWKNKDTSWYHLNTADNFVSISADGISNKAQVIKSTFKECDVKGYYLNEIKFIQISEHSVLLTYIATQEGTCGGIKLNSKVRVSANYIKQKDKWLEAFYIESKME